MRMACITSREQGVPDKGTRIAVVNCGYGSRNKLVSGWCGIIIVDDVAPLAKVHGYYLAAGEFEEASWGGPIPLEAAKTLVEKVGYDLYVQDDRAFFPETEVNLAAHRAAA